MILFKYGKKFKQIPTKAHENTDVSGLGDQVIDTCLCSMPVEAAAEVANEEARIVINRLSTTTIHFN